MGTRTTITCDWCKAETPSADDGGSVKGWCERGGELLCPECIKARDAAIRSARERRVAGPGTEGFNLHVSWDQFEALRRRFGRLKMEGHSAVQSLVQAMWLYSGYKVAARGPIGCLIEAIEKLEPETAKKIRAGEAGDDWGALRDPEDDVGGVEAGVAQTESPDRTPDPKKATSTVQAVEEHRSCKPGAAGVTPASSLDSTSVVPSLKGFGERLLAIWEEAEGVALDKEDRAAWSGATKDLLLGLGLEWDGQEDCYYLDAAVAKDREAFRARQAVAPSAAAPNLDEIVVFDLEGGAVLLIRASASYETVEHTMPTVHGMSVGYREEQAERHGAAIRAASERLLAAEGGS